MARSHTLTALAIDTAGNEQRASTTIEVGEPITTLTFVDGAYVTSTLVAGESVVLRGPATDSFDAAQLELRLVDNMMTTMSYPSTVGLVVADGMWTLDWTAPAAGWYDLDYAYGTESAYFSLTVE